MPKFSSSSLEKLHSCDYRLQEILTEVIKYYDCKVIEGHRGEIRQNELYNAKRSKVKWPNGKHNTYPSKAVDVIPYPLPDDWGEKWKDRVKFYELKAIIFYVAAQKGIKLRYGGDWDGDYDYKDQTFDDLVHFEIKE